MMRHASVYVLFLLCVQLCFVGTQSSSHNVERRETKKYSGVVVTKMVVSPTWYVNVGDTVEINCTTVLDKQNQSDKMDLQLVWTKMASGVKEVLVNQPAPIGFSYVLGPVTHEHQGVYSCQSNGSSPDIFVQNWHHVIWVADTSVRASLEVISHNRSQFLNGETFTLSCQVPSDNTQWKMMRFNEWVGNITECTNQKFSDHRVSCTTRSEYPWSNKLYWCESSTGERSNALNITTTAGVTVAMEGPTLPVLEGGDVMLRCLHRNRTTNKITSNFVAYFYKDKYMLGYEIDSIFTLRGVTKAQEGFYRCSSLKNGYSHYSWITVIAQPDKDQKTKSDTETQTS